MGDSVWVIRDAQVGRRGVLLSHQVPGPESVYDCVTRWIQRCVKRNGTEPTGCVGGGSQCLIGTQVVARWRCYRNGGQCGVTKSVVPSRGGASITVSSHRRRDGGHTPYIGG